MIRLHSINNRELVVNAELIETIEARPDTILSMSGGNKIVVKEKPDEVIKKVIEYKKILYSKKDEKLEKTISEKKK